MSSTSSKGKMAMHPAIAFDNARPTALTKARGWAGALMVLLGLTTAMAGKLWPPRELPERIKSPMFAIELLRPGVRLDSFVRNDDSVAVAHMGLRPRNERATLVRAVRIDFAFIAAYASFLLLFGAVTHGPIRRTLGVVVIVGGLTGAVFDVLENIRILRLLRDVPTPLPRDVSIIKWWSLFIVTAAMAFMTIDRGSGAVAPVDRILRCNRGCCRRRGGNLRPHSWQRQDH